MNIYLELINCSFFKQTTNCKTGTVYKYVHRTKALTSLHTKAKINTCSLFQTHLRGWRETGGSLETRGAYLILQRQRYQFSIKK